MKYIVAIIQPGKVEAVYNALLEIGVSGLTTTEVHGYGRQKGKTEMYRGAEYIVNPSATVAGLSQYLWELEQPASAVANGCFIGAINRVGSEEPWNIGKFYGSSYVVNPRGKIEAQLGEDEDGLLVHDMDMDMVREIRNLWQFFRDRRPEVYEDLIELR